MKMMTAKNKACKKLTVKSLSTLPPVNRASIFIGYCIIYIQ